MRKKILSTFLCIVVCLATCVPAYAGEELAEIDTATEISLNDLEEATASTARSSAIDTACYSVEELFDEYYQVSNVSGKVESMEAVAGGINVIVSVSYSTKIRAATPDDAPYIKGILAAMESLTDPLEIQKANDYLTIWRGELAREHIGKTVSHNASFSVFLPFASKGKASANVENNLAMDEVEIEVYTTIDTGETVISYEEPLSTLVPSEKEVMENARRDVLSIVGRRSQIQSVQASSSSRAKELDRVDAAAYAKDEDNFPYGTKPDGTKYERFDGDCANFVSQCYSAGGVEEDDPDDNVDNPWYPYSSIWTHTGGSRGSTEGVCDYMEDHDIVFQVETGEWTRAFAGSIMYYPKSLTDTAHVGIITSNDGQTAYYSAHTTDHCNEKLGSMKSLLDYYVPVWDSYTETWTPQ